MVPRGVSRLINWLHCYCQICHLRLNKTTHYENVSRVKIKYRVIINDYPITVGVQLSKTPLGTRIGPTFSDILL
jgi:hypothetical protein